MELGLLRNEIPRSSICGNMWVMPDKYDVRVLAQQILQKSPKLATPEEDVGKMGRPTFRRLNFEGGAETDRQLPTANTRTRRTGREDRNGDKRTPGAGRKNESDLWGHVKPLLGSNQQPSTGHPLATMSRLRGRSWDANLRP